MTAIEKRRTAALSRRSFLSGLGALAGAGALAAVGVGVRAREEVRAVGLTMRVMYDEATREFSWQRVQENPLEEISRQWERVQSQAEEFGRSDNAWADVHRLVEETRASIAMLYQQARQASKHKDEEVLALIEETRAKGASARELISKLQALKNRDAATATG